MKIYLKPTLTMALSIIFISKTGVAQQLPIPIQDAWAELKIQMQKRTEIVFTLTKTMSESKEVDKDVLFKAKNLATDLNKCMDSLNDLNSLSVDYANTLNSKLTQALARSIATLERDSTFKNSNPVRDLLMQLGATENKIISARRGYNIACADNGRKDLCITSNAYDDAPKIKF